MLYVENSHPVYGLIDGVLYDKQTRTLHTCIPAMCPRRFLIPEGILAIGDRAFSGCEGLAEIRIPQGLETIGGYAFSRCEGLGAVELPQSVTSIGTAAFFSSGIARVNLPEGLAVLGDHAFALCQNLQSVSLPSSLRCIAGSTFLHSGLNNCTFAEGLVEIGEYAFAYCYNLGRVQLPESIESIGASAFYECNNMPDFRIPVGVTQIGPGAFGSTDLTDVAIAEGNDVYGMRDGALYDLRTDTLHTCFGENEPVEFHIPDGTRAIGANAFDGCSKLEKVVIPDSVESIGDKAFSSCYALVRLTIPVGVREIGQSTVSYSGVSAFEVAEDNPAFEQIDGVLFEKKSHTLHTFPPEWGKEYTVPEETEIIGEGAFQSVSDL